MTAPRTLLGLLLAAVVALALAPAAQGAIFDRFRFADIPYAFEDEICGIPVQIEGTVSGHSMVRTGKGALDSAFFEHTNAAYRETWTAADGSSVTVTGNANFNEVRAVRLGGSLFRFSQVEAGQPFRLYDSQGNLLLRDRGAIRFTVVFDTLGDAEPGGIVVEELEPSVRGPHPGFDDATLCPVLVPLLTAQNRGLVQSFQNAQTTTVDVNAVAPVDISGEYVPISEAPGGGYFTRVTHDTGITLGVGESLTFNVVISFSHRVLDGFTLADETRHRPLFFGPGVTFEFPCEVTGA